MLIVGEDILKQNLLRDADKRHIKNSSYYLTIGAIIPVGEDAKNFDFNQPKEMLVIKPRQVAWVVSREVFSIKSHEITALVTLRSTFTKMGLLALDVGMVDADFEGPIGSIVINFSKNDVRLAKGDEFFRVAFIKHAEVPEEFRPSRDRFTAAEYIKDRHNDIIAAFPATFLNTEMLSDEMASKVSEKVKTDILDQVLLHLVKNHWLKIVLLIGVTVVFAAISAYFLYSKFGPTLSREDVQAIAKTWLETNFPKQLPQTK
jgi:deoxycytidine triphosphate deaminase